MIHIVYLSQAVRPLSDQDLQDMLHQCRRDNEQRQITGVLFYSHGKIAQLIEGPPEVLEPLFEKISRDGRHSHVRKLVDKSIAARSFSDWSMAFYPLEPSGFEALEGFLLPEHLPASPSTMTVADAMMVDLVRLAVFGEEAAPTAQEPTHV
jgi:hypothetical protein